TSMSATSTGPFWRTSTVARRSMSTPSARWCVWTPQPAWAIPMGGVITARPTPARSVGDITAPPSGGGAAPLRSTALGLWPRPPHHTDRRGEAIDAAWRLFLDRHLAERDERPRLAVDVEAADLAGRRPDEGVRLDADPRRLVGDDLRDPLVD